MCKWGGNTRDRLEKSFGRCESDFCLLESSSDKQIILVLTAISLLQKELEMASLQTVSLELA